MLTEGGNRQAVLRGPRKTTMSKAFKFSRFASGRTTSLNISSMWLKSSGVPSFRCTTDNRRCKLHWESLRRRIRGRSGHPNSALRLRCISLPDLRCRFAATCRRYPPRKGPSRDPEVGLCRHLRKRCKSVCFVRIGEFYQCLAKAEHDGPRTRIILKGRILKVSQCVRSESCGATITSL